MSYKVSTDYERLWVLLQPTPEELEKYPPGMNIPSGIPIRSYAGIKMDIAMGWYEYPKIRDSKRKERFIHDCTRYRREFIDPADLEITQDTSDGYHTFRELYHHRAVLFSVICNSRPELAWKSKLHSDGTMFDGMFIVGINAPEGPATYHYDVDPYWDLFRVQELSSAPEWDGHTSDDAINRIKSL